jgi:nucleotide-binding universal stress UspA family protein
MEKFQRILVPYDGSACSNKAVDEAIEIAKKFDSILFLLTVIDTATVVPHSFEPKKGTMMDVQKFAKSLKAASSQVDLMLRDEVFRCKEHGVNADYELVTGSPANIILRFAKKRKIDLIVMGSLGLVGIKKLKALGSVSRKVSEQADCPVLLVR